MCCASFLNDFAVSIKMAMTKIVAEPHEDPGGPTAAAYGLSASTTSAPNALPSVGATVVTTEGEGKVTAQNPMKGTVSVQLEEGKTQEFPAEEVEEKKA